MTEQAFFSRQVPWLAHPEKLVASLARAEAWCWLDGEADGQALHSDSADTAAHSYFAAAASVIQAEVGREREFLDTLERDLPITRGNLAHPADSGIGSAIDPARGFGHTERSGFRGGWVTALSYEFGVGLIGSDVHPDSAPPAFALRITELLELDHRTHRATLYGSSEAALDGWLAQHGHAWSQHTTDTAITSFTASWPDETPNMVNWRRTRDTYEQQVRDCQHAITDGDAYVICLTDLATAHTESDPLTLYLRLRHTRPSLRGGIIVTGDRALISASPERFLSLHDRELRTHPVKGTRTRGATPQLDTQLATELAADPKERAENLMIVDLMRNDLSKVCDPGTVRTQRFLHVESHPHVHQLVSTVGGTILPAYGLADIMTACFPGGSMTGAPKRRAIEILANLEAAPRGLYAGCFGWVGVDPNGALELELAMTIRSIELRGTQAHIGAGGGITADSVPAAEHDEKILKAQPLLATISQ